MTPATRVRLRRVCLFLAIGLAIWVGVAYYTGGFTIRVGSFRLLSARSLRNPAILAVLFAALWWRLAPRGAVAETFTADVAHAGGSVAAAAQRASSGPISWVTRTSARIAMLALHAGTRYAPRFPLWIAIAATAAAVATATFEGVFVVGGADSYGYVSQAHLWAEGRIRVDEPLIDELQPLAPAVATVPLGYHLTPDGQAMVPSYSPGFPMLMTLFQWVAGRDAVFAALPVMAGVMVWATFLLGRLVAGAAVGAAAALLLAVSPTFVFQSIAPPMSDVPGAAWWTLALALMGSTSVAAAVASGLAAACAVLTRPNLVPLAVLPLVVIAWPMLATRTLQRQALTRAALYSLCVAAGCVVVGAVNWASNGSPLASGYGPLSGYYDWSNWAHNLDRYTRWLVETQTPYIALALVAPVVLWLKTGVPGTRVAERVVVAALAVFATGVGLSYLYYLRFDSWVFLRFLLPAYPILFAFMSVTLLAAARRLPRSLATPVFVLAIGLLAWEGVSETRARGVFFTGTERKYALIGRYVDRRLPANGIVFASQHGGSVRYYSGRKIVRWDLVDAPRIGAVIARVRERGYEPYLLVENWEVEPFRQRFAADPVVAVLDTTPVARLPLGDIRLYSLAPAGEPPRATETIPDP